MGKKIKILVFFLISPLTLMAQFNTLEYQDDEVQAEGFRTLKKAEEPLIIVKNSEKPINEKVKVRKLSRRERRDSMRAEIMARPFQRMVDEMIALREEIRGDGKETPDSTVYERAFERALAYFERMKEVENERNGQNDYFASAYGSPIYNKVLRDSMYISTMRERQNISMPLEVMGRITSFYGMRQDPLGKGTRFHDGIDIACQNAYVRSMLPGEVIDVGNDIGGYGNYVVIKHNNMECLYGHLSKVFCYRGQQVGAGMIVARSGNTGRSTGPHLHLRIRSMGKSVDPSLFLALLKSKMTGAESRMGLGMLTGINAPYGEYQGIR